MFGVPAQSNILNYLFPPSDDDDDDDDADDGNDDLYIIGAVCLSMGHKSDYFCHGGW